MIDRHPMVRPSGSPTTTATRTSVVGHVGPLPSPHRGRSRGPRSRVGYVLARWWDRIGPRTDDFFFVLEENDVMADLEYGRD